MSNLPYQDKKPQGSADFYYGINATFRFILKERGKEGFVRWLRSMGKEYFAPANQIWKSGGLPALAQYWKDFFAAEPGGEVEVIESEDEVVIQVKNCPAIAHLRNGKRKIVPCFCQHCYYLNQARAEVAGLSMTVEGGDGRCSHHYTSKSKNQQDLSKIKEVVEC